MRAELLTAEQEKELAAMVQDLLRLEAVAAEAGAAGGRTLTDAEWMEAAGASETHEDPKTALKIFQERLQAGRQAKQVMISANYKLVVSICRKYQGHGMTMGDLINEGIAGLVKGVERFQPSKGFKFSTYAHWWIRQAVSRSLAEQGRLVRCVCGWLRCLVAAGQHRRTNRQHPSTPADCLLAVSCVLPAPPTTPNRLPSHMQDMMSKMTRFSKAFEAQYGREPEVHELAAELGVDPVRIRDAYNAVSSPRSLDQPMGDSEGGTLGDLLEVSVCWCAGAGVVCRKAREITLCVSGCAPLPTPRADAALPPVLTLPPACPHRTSAQ
jgi:DNA-directed RNA polymerase sigma subunit (sigma70/sigma32)